MNERIRELAELCTSSFVNMHCEWEDDFDKEKFAELIVAECAELFEIEYGQSEVSGNEVAKVLKNHFGVE